jgi:hypothetical protein
MALLGGRTGLSPSRVGVVTLGHAKHLTKAQDQKPLKGFCAEPGRYRPHAVSVGSGYGKIPAAGFCG